VLESRHVIGLFLVMMLFSAGFFTLGYFMGRDQYGGQVRAATDFFKKPEISVSHKTDVTPAGPAAAPNSDWEFYHAGDNKKPEDRLKPVVGGPAPAQKSIPVLVRTTAAPRKAGSSSKTRNAPLGPEGAYTLQVAAVTKEADALELAARLQKKRFPAFVLSPRADKYYHVQVGPYADPKAADVARKGLEDAGFNAIVKH